MGGTRWLLVGMACMLAVVHLAAADKNADKNAEKKTDLQLQMERLKSPFASEVVMAARSLSIMGPEAKIAVPEIAQALRRMPFPEDRIAVAKALSRMGPASAEGVPAIAHVLETASFSNERVALIKILGDMGPQAKDAVPTLTKLLRAVFADERRAAADALGKMGPAAKVAIPALTEASQSGFGDIRLAAKDALKRVQTPDTRAGIVDQGRLFNAIFLRSVQDDVTALARNNEIDIVIETQPTPPRDPNLHNHQIAPEDALASLPAWINQRVKEREIDGVYVFIIKEPVHVHVEAVGKGKTVFDDAAVRRLTDTLLADFKFRRFDQGLTHAVDFLRIKLNHGIQEPPIKKNLTAGFER